MSPQNDEFDDDDDRFANFNPRILVATLLIVILIFGGFFFFLPGNPGDNFPLATPASGNSFQTLMPSPPTLNITESTDTSRPAPSPAPSPTPVDPNLLPAAEAQSQRMAIYNVVVTDQAQLTLLNSLLTADGDNTGTFNSIAATAKTANQSLENLSLGPCMKAALKTFEQQNDTIIQVAQTLISAPQTILFGKAKITDPLNPLSMSISTMGLYADSLKGNTRLCVKPS